MDTQTPWYIIVNTIQFNHRSGENATRILHALKEAGYTIERADLPETMSVYSPDPRNTSMFAGAKPPQHAKEPAAKLSVQRLKDQRLTEAIRKITT